VGTGPYGLAAGAALRHAGFAVVVVGRGVMDTWKRSMPERMLLRTDARASTIGHPSPGFTFPDFAVQSGAPRESARLVERQALVAYGEWYAERAALPVLTGEVVGMDRRGATLLTRVAPGDGGRARELSTRAVVIAAGLGPARVPRPIRRGLPPELYTHAAHVTAERERFGGSRVGVIGGGQSALEAVDRLVQAGATVCLVHRAAQLLFRELPRGKSEWRLRLDAHVARLVYWASAALRRAYVAHHLRPSAEPSLARCLPRVTSFSGRSVVGAAPRGQEAELALDDGTRVAVDHLVLATGYRPSIGALAFLGPLVAAIDHQDGYPVLGPGFASSVPGLHFVGSLAERSHGPAMRFLFGTRTVGARRVRSVQRAVCGPG
jgi:cation diffusion facilitator CzcD-associated flavoprotein CzcO